MRKRYIIGAGIALLVILMALEEWQVSFDLGGLATNPAQTVTFWAISTLIFLLMVTLGFMLFKNFFKLYLERQRGREGSRLKSKLVFGALALSLLPVIFMFGFSYAILNRNVDKWFSRPAEGIKLELVDTAVALGDEVQGRAQSLANWFALQEGVANGTEDLTRLCADNRIAELRIEDSHGVGRVLCPDVPNAETARQIFSARAQLASGDILIVRLRPRVDLAHKQSVIQSFIREYDQLSASKRAYRNMYLLFLVLIALFILFVSTWIVLVLARQISVPISALLEAAGQIRRGNLNHRVSANATDELATLVRAFNEMIQALQANSRELETRRQFTEAILESIPTGVISLSGEGFIQRGNRALHGLFPSEQVDNARRLEDLFPLDDVREIRYLMKRAQRTGVAATQLDLEPQAGQGGGHVRHLAVTVSALSTRDQREDQKGFVLVLEDTSELLRAQKAAAWHEVARRIAHELKNPLTPIALSAQRIGRLLDRGAFTADSQRILRECASTISREVESVQTLADEFSQFSRFPAAHPAPSDLNEVVRNALAVFSGRLEGIDLRTDFADHLPPVNIDAEQFQRVVVNLVDNAAEAMRDSLVKRLLVATRVTAGDTVELLVADTGGGISAGDKEKLFLPYFSTKGRGTGLGLAIVSQILSEHGARIRVEDNRPTGARFYVEVPAAMAVEAEARG
jgi:nitrogen fixation/metabolism regulation signal transduction histidine kinase